MKSNIPAFIISRSLLLGMRSVSGRIAEKIKTHFLCSVTFFFLNCAICEITWKNTEGPNRSQMKIWRMRITCAIFSHRICNTAFPLQEQLYVSALMLPYTYIFWVITYYFYYYRSRRSKRPRGLRRGSAAAHLLRLCVRIPPWARTFVCWECSVCCKVEVYATSWSLVQRSPTDCGVSLCVI